MTPGGDLRRSRRTRTVLVVVAVVLAVLLVLGLVGVLGVRYVSGLVSDAGGGGYGEPGEELAGADVPVERMDLTATVAATGSLTAGRPVVLSFGAPGEVTAVEVAVGDEVVPGQVLARLDPRLAQLDLDAARATLVAAQRAAGAGSAGDDEQAAQARAAEARVQVEAARTALSSTREVAAANAVALDSAVDAAVRQRDREDAAAGAAEARAAAAARPSPAVRQAAATELAAARTAASAARTALVAAAEQVAVAQAGGNRAAVAVAEARQAAAQTAVQAAEARVADAQEVLADHDATVAQADAARSEATAARAGADAAAEAVVVATDARRTGLAVDAQGVDSARSALAQAEAALQVLLTGDSGEVVDAGPVPEELQVAVDRALLDVEAAEAALAGTTLTAPVAATVTAVDATVGTEVGGGGTLAPEGDPDGGGSGGGPGAAPSAGTVTLTAEQGLVAEVTVPETDAVAVEAGMPAELKFSAIPDVVGAGRVVSVVAAEATEGDQGFDPFTGQPTPPQKSYTVAVALDEVPAGARAGLSVAVRVTTGDAPDALAVPSAALVRDGARTTVQVVGDDGGVAEVEVEVGIRQGGFTEVVGGLDEGAVVRVGDPFAGPDGTTGEELPDGVELGAP